MRLNVKKALHIFGVLLMLGSLTLIALKLANYRALLYGHLQTNPWQWLSLFVFSLGHLGILNLLGMGWRLNLQHLGQAVIVRKALSIYGISQIGKYLPGNVMHFAGRQWLAQRWQLQQSKVLQATLNEILGHLLAVSICIAVFACLNVQKLSALFVPFDGYFAGVYWVLMLVLTVCCLPVVRHQILRMSKPLVAGFSRMALAYYLSFHLLGGVLFIATIKLFSPLDVDTAWILLSYALAWLIGFVVPGAPGGLGIREMVLLYLLAGMFPESTILMATIANRLLTTLGDVWFFLQAQRMHVFLSKSEHAL